MIVFDPLWETLKKKKVSQYSLIHDYKINESQLDRFRKNCVVKTITLNHLCEILDCEIGDICKYVKESDKEK